MYAVFKRHRALKLIGLLLAALLLSYVGHGAAAFYEGRSIMIDDLLGYYAYGVTHQLDIKSEHLGRLVSDGSAFNFSFDFENGTFLCKAAEGDATWRMKSLAGNKIYSEYDYALLYKQEVSE